MQVYRGHKGRVEMQVVANGEERARRVMSWVITRSTSFCPVIEAITPDLSRAGRRSFLGPGKITVPTWWWRRPVSTLCPTAAPPHRTAG